MANAWFLTEEDAQQHQHRHTDCVNATAALLLDTPLTLCWGVKWALRSRAVPAHLTLHLLGE